MFKTRRKVAEQVAESLFAAEKAIDAALARAASLNETMVTASAEANLSSLVGQDAFEVTSAAYSSLARARSEIVEAHKRLSETKIEIGLRTIAFGDLVPKPPKTQGELRAVA